METTVNKTHNGQTGYNQTSVTGNTYDRWISKLNFSYFGIISMTILIGSIVGGVSAMYILKSNAPIWQLGLCMAVAMANNVAAIGQAPTKWVVNLFFACVGINALLILANIL